MSTLPPIRIRRTRPSPVSAPAPAPAPKPATPRKQPTVPVAPPRPEKSVVPAVVKVKGPATTARKPRPPLTRVENPQRLRKKGRKPMNGVLVGNRAWGSPFRPREADGRWCVVWVGSEQGLDEFKPVGWEDVPCQDRQEAAQLCLRAFHAWITADAQATLLENARASLRGYNLVCRCPVGYPCHGGALLELVNPAKEPTP